MMKCNIIYNKIYYTIKYNVQWHLKDNGKGRGEMEKTFLYFCDYVVCYNFHVIQRELTF